MEYEYLLPILIFFLFPTKNSGDVLVGIVHTNIKYREHVIGEEVNQFPVRAMGNGGISRQEIGKKYALKIYDLFTLNFCT